MRGLTLITTGLSLLGPAAAILVADNSPCGTVCGNVLDATTNDDVVCHEGDYTSGSGIVFQQCLTCEQNSDYSTKSNETDQQYFLYNLRYATSYCLFGIPDNKNTINTPCLTSKACGPFQNAIVYNNLSSEIEGYDYCDTWPVNDSADFAGCTECLQAGDNHYLANFITVLQAGCEQQPKPGTLVSTEGTIFSRDNVNVTEPTPVASVDPDWFDHGPLSLDAKVGIAAGGVVLILIILGFCIIWRGRRRRRAFLSMLETKHGNSWPTPLTIPRETRDTPLSQKPLRSWDESPVSVRSDQLYPPHHVSPFASQYSSPVSATELKLAHWPVMAPNQQMTAAMNGQQPFPPMFPSMYQPDPSSSQIGVALGGDDSSVNSGNSKGKGRQGEEYEMTPVENPHAHAGIGIYQPEIQHNGEPSRTAFPQPGYFPEGLTNVNQTYGYPNPSYGYYDDHQRTGRSPQG